MNILVIGGTRFFGVHMVNELLLWNYFYKRDFRLCE